MRIARLAIAQILVIGILVGSAPAASAGIAADVTWTMVDLHAEQVLYDQSSGTVVAAVRPSDPDHANEVLAFDPVTLSVLWSVPFPSQPDLIAISDDGSSVYVGLGDSNSIARIGTASHSVMDTIQLPDDPRWGPVEAEDIAVAPGNPGLIAVALERGGITSAGITVFDDGVALPDVAHASPYPDSIAFGANAGVLYGLNTKTSGFDFVRMTVSSSGVTVDDFTRSFVIGSHNSMVYADGRLYFENAWVADPSIPELVDRYTTEETVNVLVPVPSLDLAMGISSTTVPTIDTLTLFDLDGFNVVDELNFTHGQVYGVHNATTIEGHGIVAAYSEKVLIAGFFPGGDITGRVTDASSDEPISEVCVYATDDETYIVSQTETLDDGSYSMRVPPGTWRIAFGDCHYADYFWEWHNNQVFYNFAKATPVTVNDGDTVTVNGALERTYNDSLDSVFREQIWWMHDTGITSGCAPEAYCPDGTVTRGQMAAFLVRALGLTATSSIDFTDDDGNIFEQNINKLATADITKGCNPPTNDKFCPNDPVTRGQMAAFLVRALGLTATSDVDFVDDNGSVFEENINKLATAGITKGCNPPTNDKFCPNDPVTRGQMAAFLFRALESDFALSAPGHSLRVEVPAPDLDAPLR